MTAHFVEPTRDPVDSDMGFASAPSISAIIAGLSLSSHHQVQVVT